MTYFSALSHFKCRLSELRCKLSEIYLPQVGSFDELTDFLTCTDLVISVLSTNFFGFPNVGINETLTDDWREENNIPDTDGIEEM